VCGVNAHLSPCGQIHEFVYVEPDQTILLADESEDDVLLTRIAFRKAHLANRLEVVRDGEEAIAYFEGTARFADRRRFPVPILLLLDLKLPKVTGFEVLEGLRQKKEFVGLPIAILTCSEEDPFAARAFELGANSFLVKPPNAGTLLALVQKVHAGCKIVPGKELLDSAS
jgi:CheY-like chemotaxis protein